MKTTNDLFGRNVRKERIKKGFSVAQLAKKAHISRQYLHSLETGRPAYNITLKSALQVAKALQVKLEELL